MSARNSAVFCMGIWAAMATPSHAEPLKIYYENRPPYAYLENGALAGSVGSVAIRALNSARIEYELHDMPVVRQVAIVGGINEASCAIGLYRTEERARNGKFTLPIFRTPPEKVMIRRSDEHLRKFSSLKEMLGDSTVRIVVRNGYSYGDEMDKMLANAKATVMRLPENSQSRMRLVQKGIADATLFAGDETQFLLQNFGNDQEAIFARHFDDTPPGPFRYMYCSKQVTDETMQRLNDAIGKQ